MAGSGNRGSRYLIAALVLLACAYLALRPTLRRVSAEAERLDRETADRQALAAHSAKARTEIDKLKASAEAAPNDPAVQMRYAGALSQLGRLDDAEEAGLKALRARPDDPAIRLFLADVQYRSRRYFDAILNYRAVLAKDPSNREALAGLGWQYILMGWTVEAREFLDKAVRVAPDDPHIKAALALACLQHDDFQNSETQLLEVRQMAPKDSALWEPLVDLYIKWKRYDDAIRVANEALRIDPNNVKILNGLAQACFRKGDVEGARRAAEQSVAASADNVQGRFTLAKCYERMNRPEDAIREYETVYKQSPGYEQTALLLGQLYVRKGREADGKKLMAEYEARVPQGQKHERISLHLSMHPSSADDHYKMAEVYLEENDSARAIAELRRSLEIDPKRTDAQLLLDRAIKAQKGSGS